MNSMNAIMNKKQHGMARSGTKHLPNKVLLEELFQPRDPTNIETDFAMEDMGVMLGDKSIRELLDKIKAAHNHLSSIGGK